MKDIIRIKLLFSSCLLFSLFFISSLWAIQPDKKNLPIGLASFEAFNLRYEEVPQTPPPGGKVRSLGEWEDSQAVMVLWNNKSLISALASRNKVKILADDLYYQNWWQEWLADNNVNSDNISFYVVPTNSIWVRDYGPLFILDDEGQMGIVDTVYNRPRPLDDLVPEFIAQELELPIYQPGLVHTGGNFYADGLGNGFSSTLVFRENPMLTKVDVYDRMEAYLGIERYTTGKLAPGITIEHFDTFGKLVAPDTFVFSEFPEGSRYRADSENMVSRLKTLKSPYGTPYKIIRMKMIPKVGWYSDNYRAYINSFISNRVLYFPTYGDEKDDYVKEVYQKTLPGYEIVGVDARSTSWGDSIHCRTRNIHKQDTLFIFPTIPYVPSNEKRDLEILAEVFPSPGGKIDKNPLLHWRVNNSRVKTSPMPHYQDDYYKIVIPGQIRGSKISLYIEAEDTNGVRKTAPIAAPDMTIEFFIQ